MNVRDIIRKSNVKVICTTDDPIDDLRFHKQIAAEGDCGFKVYPTFRPDKAMNIEKPDFCDYLAKLEKVAGSKITSLKGLTEALRLRMEFFKSNGCRATDHALDYIMYAPADENEIEAILRKRLGGGSVTDIETAKFKTFMLEFFAARCSEYGLVMQIHYGAKRDNNGKMFKLLGADTGFDTIGSNAPISEAANFINSVMSKEGKLPKTILYSLNPSDNAAIGTLIGCFQNSDDGGVRGQIQHGSAWWFNDHIDGMRAQMKSLANLGSLAAFVGMLTDSRSFLSYPRHEYFRRILCNLLGEFVDNGLYPNDTEMLGRIASDISYNNTIKYFGF
jgi:glucuronate isomerase